MNKRCCICGVRFEGYGNNPEPIVPAENGERCCDQCNSIVVYRRMMDVFEEFEKRAEANRKFETQTKEQ